MQIQHSILRSFAQLTSMLEQLSDIEYNATIAMLSGATIGQHIRHVIECFQELETGYHAGAVNYDRRKRDLQLETNRSLAITLLSKASFANDDRTLLLTEEPECSVTTTYYRELLYNLHHTVHHMAIIRIGLASIRAISLPEDFGVASSTVKYRMSHN